MELVKVGVEYLAKMATRVSGEFEVGFSCRRIKGLLLVRNIFVGGRLAVKKRVELFIYLGGPQCDSYICIWV
jgi:hypothetical protein